MKKEYKYLLTASLIANFGDNLIGPFYAVFVEKIGGSILDIGFTVTFFSLCTGVLMIIGGKISDKVNKEFITIIGYGLYALGSLLYLVISSPIELFLLQIIFALGTVCLSAPLSALFSKYIQKGKEGMQWGLEGGGSRLAVGAASFIGTLIVNQWGFKILFIIMFCIQLSAVLLQTKLFIENRSK